MEEKENYSSGFLFLTGFPINYFLQYFWDYMMLSEDHLFHLERVETSLAAFHC